MVIFKWYSLNFYNPILQKMTCGDNEVFKLKSPKDTYKTGAKRSRTS